MARPGLRAAAVMMILALVAIGAGLSFGGGGDGDAKAPTPSRGRGPQGRDGSIRIVATTPLPMVPAPVSYDITYRIEESATDDIEVTTEQVRARRPFESHVVVRSPGSSTVRTERRSAFARLSLGGSGAAATRALAITPSLGTADLRPDAMLSDAVEAGVLRRREQRRVAGRPCQVYRAGTTALSSELVPAGAKGAELADLCIDGSGLLLEEVWQDAAGRRLRRKVATRVEAPAAIPDSFFTFDGIEAQPVESGGGAVTAASPTFVLPKGVWVLDEPPAGFVLKGRYAVIHPQLDPQTDARQVETSSRPSTLVDVWTRGPDLLVLERGQGAPFQPSPYSSRADLGALGVGEVVLDLRTSEIRAVLSDSYVRLSGTLSRADLLAAARRLRIT